MLDEEELAAIAAHACGHRAGVDLPVPVSLRVEALCCLVADRRADLADESGMFLVAYGRRLEEQIKVLRIIHGSPADQAGVRDGDLLVSIDGANAAQLGLGQIRQMLQAGDRKYSLTPERGGRSVPVVVKTHDLLTSPAAVAP